MSFSRDDDDVEESPRKVKNDLIFPFSSLLFPHSPHSPPPPLMNQFSCKTSDPEVKRGGETHTCFDPMVPSFLQEGGNSSV